MMAENENRQITREEVEALVEQMQENNIPYGILHI